VKNQKQNNLSAGVKTGAQAPVFYSEQGGRSAMSNPIQANPALLSLTDMASEAHARIQQDYAELNPVIGVMQGMRKMGIPADVISIDCLPIKKRILIILHDEHPGLIQYQYTYTDQDPGDEYQAIKADDASSDTLYQWMLDYFQP
tara:strand:- start:15822 stop:16256 length:435 start_codon:yes stop_codon:yes gene_type:complete